jgi:hypothetical protein
MATMRKSLIPLVLYLVGLTAFAIFAVFAVQQASQLGGGWGELKPILPFVIGGAIVVAALTGGLMWLAFYSARRGFDDRADQHEP